MKKYEGLLASERPDIIRPLPELHYPERLNIARVVARRRIAKGLRTARRIFLQWPALHLCHGASRGASSRQCVAPAGRAQKAKPSPSARGQRRAHLQHPGGVGDRRHRGSHLYPAARARPGLSRSTTAGAGIMIVDAALLAEGGELPALRMSLSLASAASPVGRLAKRPTTRPSSSRSISAAGGRRSRASTMPTPAPMTSR